MNRFIHILFLLLAVNNIYGEKPYFGTSDIQYEWQGDVDLFEWLYPRTIQLKSDKESDKKEAFLYTEEINLSEVTTWQFNIFFSQYYDFETGCGRVYIMSDEASADAQNCLYLEIVGKSFNLIQLINGEETNLGKCTTSFSDNSFSYVITITKSVLSDGNFCFKINVTHKSASGNYTLKSGEIDPQTLEGLGIFAFYFHYESITNVAQNTVAELSTFSVETGEPEETDDEDEDNNDDQETPSTTSSLLFGNEYELYSWEGDTENFLVYDNNSDKNTLLQLNGDSENGGTATIYTQDVEISNIKSWYSELYYVGFNPSSSNYMMVMLATDETYENYLALKYQKNVSLVLSKNGKETKLMTDDRYDVSNTDNQFLFQITRTVTANNNYQLDIILNFDEDDNDYTSTVTIDPEDMKSMDRMAINFAYTKSRAKKMYAAYFTVGKGFEDVEEDDEDENNDEDIDNPDDTEDDEDIDNPDDTEDEKTDEKTDGTTGGTVGGTTEEEYDDEENEDDNDEQEETAEKPYSTSFSRGSIVINELMPVNLDLDYLPDCEYIELYNNTNSEYDLTDWTLRINTTNKTLPEISIPPHDYLLITSNNYVDAFEGIADNVLGISWTNINNTSCSIILTNPDGLVSDVFDYDSSLFGTDFHGDGGFSLEKIDPANLSLDNNLWQVSNSDFGGTPGSENYNSYPYPDIYSPEILNMHIDTTGLILTVDYSEPIDTSRLCKEIKINGATTSVNPICDDNIRLKRIVYNLTSPLFLGQIYEITALKEFDLAGNQLEDTSWKIAIPEQAEEGDILINEIMFSGSPYANDFVELYNNSKKAINLRSLFFCVYTDDEITKHERISESTRIMLPGDYFVFTKDSTILLNNYDYVEEKYAISTSGFGTTSTGNLDNTSATIAISNANGKVIIDKAYYNKDMHAQSLVSTDNVSIERLRFSVSAMEYTNWASASETYGYATPTKKNSQSREDLEAGNDEITISNSIFTPNGDGDNDYLIIQVNISDESTWTATLKVFNAIGQLIATPQNNVLISASSELTWDGKTDDGSSLPPGNYALYIEMWNDHGKVKHYKKGCTIAITPR